ncbi:2-oxoglutarate and iron-dependent oxygenase domain-containing protein 3-like [Actinia tenebrosa]|uniref:2-oxoglutarate and iron-dependent oxygenase domain-containing protein 3-like n=1 Tax=Actinia tenebrosa TaxID=6105 RepID=A0A6P8IQ44_ACTTE|nr:2-oxoglutarate and iron-dependent oxygenase domain-containing protein 3-like [Actinia tenebrosa]
MPVVQRKRGKEKEPEKIDQNGVESKSEENKEKKGKPGSSSKKGISSASKISKAKDIEGVQILPRIAIAVALIAGFVCARDFFLEWYLEESGESTFASVSETIPRRYMDVKCSNDYGKQFKDCVPKKCGRIVMDGVVSLEEATHLVKLAKKGMKHGKPSGGPTILDLHTGALTYEDKFVNIYTIAKKLGKGALFKKEDFDIYRQVKNKVHNTIAREFNINKDKLYLTKPTFFSRMKAKPAKTIHDEYWHQHVDKKTYGSFYYTSLLYLSDYSRNFTGGRFVFVDKASNHTVEPKTGRLSFFTSGSENVHFVEKVTKGTRFAITISFTCEKKFAIADPSLENNNS